MLNYLPLSMMEHSSINHSFGWTSTQSKAKKVLSSKPFTQTMLSISFKMTKYNINHILLKWKHFKIYKLWFLNLIMYKKSCSTLQYNPEKYIIFTVVKNKVIWLTIFFFTFIYYSNKKYEKLTHYFFLSNLQNVIIIFHEEHNFQWFSYKCKHL